MDTLVIAWAICPGDRLNAVYVDIMTVMVQDGRGVAEVRLGLEEQVVESGTRGQLDLATFARLRDCFSREKPVPAAYLFGSRASGRFSANSDVDVAVILRPGLNSEDAFWECAAIKDALEATFRPAKVDVLDIERIPCRIAHEVLKTGVLVAQNDEGRRVEVEARRRSEYFDFLPRLRYYRKEILGLDQQRANPGETR